jgi:hypothetical protein
MKFGMWNERSLYRASSLMADGTELRKYKSDLVEAQEVRWNMGGTESAGKYTSFYGLGNQNHRLGTGLFFCIYENDINS